MQALAKDLLLHEGLAEGHVHAPLHLSDDQGRIDGTTDVVSNPHFVNRHEPRLLLDAHLHHAGRVAIGRGWTDA